MSVITYLEKTYKSLKIRPWEKNIINTSTDSIIKKLKNNLNFIDDIIVFGSYSRDLMLKRSIDSNSDIDIMVVFNNDNKVQPQTLIERLKNFARNNYSRNEVFQDTPSVVLELGHIRFELTPAYKIFFWKTLQIPAPKKDYKSWMNTSPTIMKDNLIKRNKECNYLTRKLIRLMKYWNVLNDKVYSSYELETYIVSTNYYGNNNIKEYLYYIVKNLPIYDLNKFKLLEVNKLKNIINSTEQYERSGQYQLAEIEISKMFIK